MNWPEDSKKLIDARMREACENPVLSVQGVDPSYTPPTPEQEAAYFAELEQIPKHERVY